MSCFREAPAYPASEASVAAEYENSAHNTRSDCSALGTQQVSRLPNRQ